MTLPQIGLLIVFLVFLTGCGIYIARATKRQKQHNSPNPERTMKLEEEQARVENGPSRR